MVLGVVPRQGHGEVEAQPVLGELATGALGRLEILPALEYLEDQLLVLAPLAAHEQAEALEGGRFDPAKSEGAVHRDDLLGGGVAQVDLGG